MVSGAGAPVGRSFGGLDWVVLAAYAAALLAIGFHFSRRQRTTEEFFTGGRRMNPVLAGISVFAAYFSIISYIATPGEYVQYGPTQVVWGMLLALPFTFLIVGWLIIPVIMRLPITSAFELLEARLGRTVRQASSISYVVARIFWMGMILFTASTIMVHVLDCDPRWAIPIATLIGAVTTTYTLAGGIRTVMITEAVQSSMLMVGALLTIILISRNLGGVGAWFPPHWQAHWLPQPIWSSDLHMRTSLVATFLSLLIGGICYTVTDQASVQRLLTTRDAQTARRAYLLSNLAVATVSILLGLVGAALLVFFQRHAEAIPDHLTFARDGDAFFPYYISHYLPRGISGLVVASLLAASMSCLSGGLNATTTVITKDLIEVWSPGERGDAAKMRRTRWLVLVLGVTAVGMCIVMGSVSGDLNEVASKTLNLLICPTFGLFFLAIFVSYATPFGAIIGAVYSTTAAALVGYWDVFTGLPKISFLWLMPISFAVSLAAGSLFSLLPTRGRSATALAGISVATLVPLVAIVAWILRTCH
jgi:SSS family solute:Na+ symporter